MFIFGIASGAAMIPYSIIKEVNPDNVKGSATGGINFLVFALTAFLGPVFASHVGREFGTAADLNQHFQKGAIFWIACCAAAIVVSFFFARRDAPHTLNPQQSRHGLSLVCCGRFRPGLSRIQRSNNEI